MKSDSYDAMAFGYDFFSQFLGRSYRESKFTFLEKLQEGDKVLYLGGGTGRNLSAILDRVGDSGKVFYMESSVQMIEKAKKKISLGLEYRVNFLHQSDFTAIPLETFDVVVTQYFLDILPDRSIHRLFQEINKRPHKNRQWIFVDFFEVKGKIWLINLMIYFFKFFTGNPERIYRIMGTTLPIMAGQSMKKNRLIKALFRVG